MDIALIGGHGKIALLAEPLLTEVGHTVDAVIRNPEHAAEVEATGARAVVEDIEHLDADGWERLVRGHDVVVWSAGAGGGDPQRTWAVDRDAAIAAYDAAKAAGFTTAQLKKGGYVRPSLKGAAKPATTKKEPAPSPSADTDSTGGEPHGHESGQQNHDGPASEHHQNDHHNEHSEHDAMAS